MWWSLANEYDILERPDDRWDGVFRTLQRIDPYGRLRSIHNWIRLYDHNKPWVTHVSLQNGSAVADFGRALLYRDAYRKPIVLDEIKYEGNTVERWGNLSARELVHRFWIATVSGTYASHGESFLVDGGTLSIVAGGPFRGESPARLAFLGRILEEVDGAGLDPIDKWDDPTYTAGIPRRSYLQYLGRVAPASWSFRLPQGVVGERLQVGDRVRGRRHRHLEHDGRDRRPRVHADVRGAQHGDFGRGARRAPRRRSTGAAHPEGLALDRARRHCAPDLKRFESRR